MNEDRELPRCAERANWMAALVLAILMFVAFVAMITTVAIVLGPPIR